MKRQKYETTFEKARRKLKSKMDKMRRSTRANTATVHDKNGENPLDACKNHAPVRDDLRLEHLTPCYTFGPSRDEFPFMDRPLQISPQKFQSGIARLARWTYHIEAGEASTRPHGTYNDGTIRFHRHRTNLISATVARMMGREIASADVLDLGCNCGVFTIDMADRGFHHALGIDFRPENIAQAELLKRAFGVDNAEFRIKNVKELAEGGRTFDVVLNLGLMYHLSTPFEGMRLCYEVTHQFCVVDTIVHKEPFSGYHVALKDTSSPIEGNLSFELQPTYRGILDTIKAAGFRDVAEIIAPANDVELYSDGSRRCLIAFKQDPGPYIARL